MLTSGERDAVRLLREAGDSLRLLEADADSALALEHTNGAISAVYARAGRRDEDNLAQAEYLAEKAGKPLDPKHVPADLDDGGS